MNAHDSAFATGGDLAELIYSDGEFFIRRSGRFVLCAVTGVRIPLDALRYWSPDLQEAYAGPAEAFSRMGVTR